MNGARNRRHGHQTELMVCEWLKVNGYPLTLTTRAILGHDGSRQPGDVSFRPDVLLEVKSRISSSWPSWISKAKSECLPGQQWIVVRRTAGNRDVGTWSAASGNAGHAFDTRSTFAEAIGHLEAVA